MDASKFSLPPSQLLASKVTCSECSSCRPTFISCPCSSHCAPTLPLSMAASPAGILFIRSSRVIQCRQRWDIWWDIWFHMRGYHYWRILPLHSCLFSWRGPKDLIQYSHGTRGKHLHSPTVCNLDHELALLSAGFLSYHSSRRSPFFSISWSHSPSQFSYSHHKIFIRMRARCDSGRCSSPPPSSWRTSPPSVLEIFNIYPMPCSP